MITGAAIASQQAFASLRLGVSPCLQGRDDPPREIPETPDPNCRGKTAHAGVNCVLTQSRQDAKNRDSRGEGEVDRGAGVVGGDHGHGESLEGDFHRRGRRGRRGTFTALPCPALPGGDPARAITGAAIALQQALASWRLGVRPAFRAETILLAKRLRRLTRTAGERPPMLG